MRLPESVAFVQPRSIEQAVECLETYGEYAKLVAGATALTIMLRQDQGSAPGGERWQAAELSEEYRTARSFIRRSNGSRSIVAA